MTYTEKSQLKGKKTFDSVIKTLSKLGINKYLISLLKATKSHQQLITYLIVKVQTESKMKISDLTPFSHISLEVPANRTNEDKYFKNKY